jgi:polar amino acid transport system permease protein
MAMSPRKRAQVSRGVQYAILAVVVVAIAFAADWPTLKDTFISPEITPELFPEILTIALKNTVFYTAGAFVFGLVLGLILALMRLSPVGPYRWIATTFVEFFRGVPALIVFIGFYYGLPIAFPGRQLPGGTFGTVTIALGLVGAAYMAETIRAGIQAVPKGQTEAARSLGMKPGRAMVSIIIPQAFRIIIPPLTNEFIALIKDTSLLFVLGTTADSIEITKFARDNVNDTFNITPLVAAALVYLAITVPMTRAVAVMERRAARAR